MILLGFSKVPKMLYPLLNCITNQNYDRGRNVYIFNNLAINYLLKFLSHTQLGADVEQPGGFRKKKWQN